MSLILHESAGGLLYRLSGELEIYLLKHSKYGYVFPKGHREKNETPLETAIREVREESGFVVTANSVYIDKISYSFKKDDIENIKEVTYYGFCIDESVQQMKQQLETGEQLLDGEWFSYSDALQNLAFESDKKLLIKLYELLHL